MGLPSSGSRIEYGPTQPPVSTCWWILNSLIYFIKFKEIRKFFMDDEHEKQIARLKEFVEVCERLNELKNSGFLDSVANTILKLADCNE